ncbi:GreA/GreB family elongation factor [Shewanella sp. C31]|nr:GreA/GreB family elongation factor [Shewanella electrica]
MGQARLGKKVGDVVEIRGKRGAQVYTILEIRPL